MIILKNKNGQIRSGFKILLLIIVKYLLDIIVSRLDVALTKKILSNNNILLMDSELLLDTLTTLHSIIMCGIMILIIVLSWKVFEKRKLNEMGLPSIKNHYKELIIGIFVGIFAVSLIEGVLLISNTVQIAKPSFNQNILLLIGRGLITTISIALVSEMLYRGYVMSLLRHTNKYLIVGISVVVEVSPLVLMNKFNILVWVNCILLALLFAYMYMKSKNIWMPIGFDFAWNYFEGYIYGFRNRGIDGSGIYQLQHINNNLLNGGEFGPQAGIVVTAIICLVFIFVYLYYTNNNVSEFMLEE